jgi:hypothetical protein
MGEAMTFPQPSSRIALGLLLLAAVGLPATLLWDTSWEATVGIDEVWAAPHLANVLAVALAGCAVLGFSLKLARPAGDGVRLGKLQAPLGAWVALWGVLAFGTAFLFGMWWRTGYGLAAGLWDPPQIMRAAAYLVIVVGVWLIACRQGTALGAALAAAALLTLVGIGTIPQNIANRQHTATFFQLACGTYPLVLVAAATAAPGRFPATAAALGYTLLMGAAVWLLPLAPGSPQVAPIYHPRTTLLPPPFPLLLVAPAIVLDLLLHLFPGRRSGWGAAVEAGLAFWFVFSIAQWPFAEFLLSPAADHWFFAGGGKHWPFFLKIDPAAQTAFWNLPGPEMSPLRTLATVGLAIAAARLGLWLGGWMKTLRR